MGQVTARVVYTSEIDGSEEVELGAHRFQFGGVGDGFCYGHQSFDCLDALTAEERTALQEAE